MHRRHRLLLAFLTTCTSFSCILAAQDIEDLGPRAERDFQAGVIAVQNGQYTTAIHALLPLYRRDPSYGLTQTGVTAYWLGQAYADTDQPHVALEAWAAGWQALRARDTLDVRLADAFIETVFTEQDTAYYDLAGSIYLTLLQHIGALSPEDALPFTQRHLYPLALILPPDVAETTGLTPEPPHEPYALAPDASKHLLTWWRQMDNLPATTRHERLQEHLARVTHVRQHFADTGTATGFDERGDMYIRFGAPSHRTPVGLHQQHTAYALIDDHRAPFMPAGDFWVYRHVDRTAHYLFVQKQGRSYALGKPTDLLPVALRLRKDAHYIEAMSSIYRMLGLFHPSGPYGSMYEQMANYQDLLVDIAATRSLPSPRGTYAVPPPRPAATYFSLASRAQAADRHAIRERDAAMPPSYSNLFDALDPLPVDLRWARFLNGDGSTRMEVYWTLRMRDLRPSKALRRTLRDTAFEDPSAYVIDTFVRQQTATFNDRGHTQTSHFVAATDARDAVLPVQTHLIPEATDAFNLGLQWDVYPANTGTSVARGPHIKIGAARIEPPGPLDGVGQYLEMSDLKPMRLDASLTLDNATPYPHTAVTSDIPLALYFEVYHLTYAADDQTHYTVAYEVYHEGRQRTLRKAVTRRTTTEAAFTGTERTAKEFVLLDLASVQERGSFEVIVHVTDTTSGRSVQRSLTFDVH